MPAYAGGLVVVVELSVSIFVIAHTAVMVRQNVVNSLQREREDGLGGR